MLNYIKKFEQSIKEYWNSPAINDHKGAPITYGELAREIEILHILWEKAGLKEGDKISLNSRSCTSGIYRDIHLCDGKELRNAEQFNSRICPDFKL